MEPYHEINWYCEWRTEGGGGDIQTFSIDIQNSSISYKTSLSLTRPSIVDSLLHCQPRKKNFGRFKEFHCKLPIDLFLYGYDLLSVAIRF